MKFLHTADWHLGAKTNGRDRLVEQKRTLDEIESIANYENIDCVIIAGDIFNTAALMLRKSAFRQVDDHGEQVSVEVEVKASAAELGEAFCDGKPQAASLGGTVAVSPHKAA